MMTPTQKEHYDNALAWVGFLVIFVGLPLLAVHHIDRYVNAKADEASLMYQQTIILSEMRDAMLCEVYQDRECDPFYQQ